MIPVKIAVVLAIIGTLVLGVISNAYHILLIAVMLLILPLFLWGYARYCAGRISFSLKTVKQAVIIGKPVPMTLGIQNSGWLPAPNIRISLQFQNLFLPQSEKQSITASVSGGKTRQLEFTLESQHTGRIRLKVSEAILFDPIGMFSRKLPAGQSVTTFIIPESHTEVLTDYSVQSVFEEEEVFSEDKPGSDVSEIFGIRPYREGDLPRQIHWKLSARMDEPMVREFSYPIHNRFIFFVDFYAENLSEKVLFRVDKMLKKLFSLSMGMVSQAIYHSIMWYDYKKNTAARHRIETLDDVYQTMQEILGTTLYDGMALGEEHCPKRSGVFYFSPDKNWNGER